MKGVLVLGAAVLVADQVTKHFALAHLPLGVPLHLIEGWLSLTLVMNPGLAFGLLGGLPPAWRWAVAALSVAALAVLARVALRILPTGGRTGRVAIGLIVGGAVGNLIDRARFGAVVASATLRMRNMDHAKACQAMACKARGAASIILPMRWR